MEQYCGTKPILESEPINIPDAKKCRVNHGLVAAIPREDMTFGVFKRKPTYTYKMRIKSSEKQEIELVKKQFQKISIKNDKQVFVEQKRRIQK